MDFIRPCLLLYLEQINELSHLKRPVARGVLLE